MDQCYLVIVRSSILILVSLAFPWILSMQSMSGFQKPQGNIFNVLDFGAKGNSRISGQGSMNSGTATLKCPNCFFTNADIGRNIYVYGASSAPYALSLGTVIQNVQGPTAATLADPATHSTSGALVQIVGSDDTKEILAAAAAACQAATQSSTSVLWFPGERVFTLYGSVIHTCSNLRITGPGTILQARIATGAAAGQGGPVISFPAASHGRFCNGGTMNPGSNVLSYGRQGKRPCNFTPADVGLSVAVAYADQNYLPLFAKITSFISKTQVALDRTASTAVPVTDAGAGRVGTFVDIGIPPMTNVEIDHLMLTDVSTAYPPDSTQGIGILSFGEDGSAFKQQIRVHDLTVETASINCLGGNNGLLDQYSFERNTLIGCADASIYIAGWNSRGTVLDNIIQNVNFPGLSGNAMGRVLHLGILVKGASNVTFANNTIRVNAVQAGIGFGDWEQFREQVRNNTIIVSATGHAVNGIEGNVISRLQITGNNIECQAGESIGILFYSGKVSDVETTGNGIRNCTIAMQFDGRGTGVGPARLKIKQNQITGCRQGLHLENTSGVNVIEHNNLRGCSGVPWLVVGSQNGTLTYITGDNSADNPRNESRIDRSVRMLPRGVSPPQ